jgi:hypothetical protein
MGVSFMSGSQQAFVYKWTHIPTGKWYIGSRTARNCHPNDGYLCSSDIVRPLIERYPDDWKREILCMGDSKSMRKKEAQFLKWFNAKKNPMSFNRSNSGGPIDGSGRKKGTKNSNSDLSITSLSKLTSEAIANLYVNETDPNRRFMLNKFIFSRVTT